MVDAISGPTGEYPRNLRYSVSEDAYEQCLVHRLDKAEARMSRLEQDVVTLQVDASEVKGSTTTMIRMGTGVIFLGILKVIGLLNGS